MVDILNKVKHGFQQSLTTVTFRTKEIVEVARIKNQLRLLKEHKQDALCELGSGVFQMYHQNNFNEEKIRAKCEKVALFSSQIQEKELELKQLHQRTEEALGKSFCFSCESELPTHAIYCSNCGEKISEEMDQNRI